MGWYETCKTEVQNMKPPGTMCDYNRCLRIQKMIDSACHSRHWEPGSPYVLDNPDGSVCYCCCSCFAEDTPIAVSADAFKLIQDFRAGDAVYAADSNLNWTQRKVEFVTNPAGDRNKAFMVHIQFGSGETAGTISVTEDHLFLTPDKKLIPAGALNPNDKLVGPNNSLVTINMVVSAMVEDGIYQLATDAPTTSMDGHLLNSNGVVSADFALQAGYIGGQLDKALLTADLDSRLKVGSPEYQAKHYNDAAKTFCSDPTIWPKGLKAFTYNTLYNIPSYARKFMTEEQAIDIMNNKEAEKRPYNSNYAIEMVEYLWTTFSAFYPEPLYVMDWNREEPNAYTWSSQKQDYILVTGGLLRQVAMNKDGLALVLSHCLATLYGEDLSNPDRNLVCVGPADYAGVITFFGNIYRDQDYISKFRSGLTQLQELWSYIDEKHRQGNPKDKCGDPGIDCRIETLQAATYMYPIPECANPHRTGFEVVSASSVEGEGTVKVKFNRKVNINTANTVANYSLHPYNEITSARVRKIDQKMVILGSAVFMGVEYTLTVNEVLSEEGLPLDPEHKSVKFELTLLAGGAGKKGRSK